MEDQAKVENLVFKCVSIKKLGKRLEVHAHWELPQLMKISWEIQIFKYDESYVHVSPLPEGLISWNTIYTKVTAP